MPICTYLGQNEYKQPLNNIELDKLLKEVCDTTGEDWRISEIEFEVRKGILRKTKKVSLYNLYVETIAPEFQSINFYRDGTEWSINTTVTAELVMAYLHGVLSGIYTKTARKLDIDVSNGV